MAERVPGCEAALRRAIVSIAAAVALATAAMAPAANADFPYPAGIDRPESSAYHLGPGQTPSNFSETGDFELTGTPDTGLTSELTVDNQADQLCGIRGISLVDADVTQPAGCSANQPVNTAFALSTGNPDVHIAVLDSGIEWNNPSTMAAVADKVWLNTGELPAPRHDLQTPLAPLPNGRTCATLANPRAGNYSRRGNYWPTGHGGDTGGAYDIIGDGAVSVLDWACDSRVAAVLHSPRYHGAVVSGQPVLTPEALILAFSDGKDQDHNGYADDIAGWNYVDNNNDPYDDVQYGHGSGEAEDSTTEADTTGTVGTCPNCMVMPLRVGESFIADANRFAEGALYATDMGADVIQEALGTYNAPRFARQAIEYAYNHGTTVIASAADEAAEHHNQPGALPDAIVVNSVNAPSNVGGIGATNVPPSYLQLNGCTNWGPRVDLAVEGSSCSSESTGKSSGVTGLIYSAAENALDAHKLSPSNHCRRVDGTACIISPNEVRQLLASGNVAGDQTAGQSAASSGSQPADEGDGGQADDVNFAAQPEPSCGGHTPGCTDPNTNTSFAADMLGGVLGPAPDTYQYPARKGFDEFYGYGRLNAYKPVAAAAAGEIPPEAEITAPDWFAQIDPGRSSFNLSGYVNARVPYTCEIDVAPGVDPNNAPAPAGDFHPITSDYCNGRAVHSGAFRGLLAKVGIAYVRSLFPTGDPASFGGNENGGQPQSMNGRPNTQPYGFTVRVVVRTTRGAQMAGEDRRQLFLHRDAQMLRGWPKELQTDGDSTPLLADIEGSDRNDLIVATSDGWIHAYRSNGREAPGWPVHTEPLPLHTGEAAYAPGGVGRHHYAAVIGGLAAGDLFHNGRMDVVAADLQGNVYGWNGQGQLVFHVHANRRFSGAPLDYPRNPTGALDNVRHGPRDRTEGGFVSAPVLANLRGGPGPLDVIASGEDRHLYAWQANGKPVNGFPVLVADPDKLTGVDATSNHLTFSTTRAQPNPGIAEDQGKLIDTPAVAYVNGPGRPPVIYVGSNEEYTVNTGDEGAINAGGPNAASLVALGATGVLPFANGRAYAVKPTGGTMSCGGGSCRSSAFESGWPVKIGIIDQGLLPDVGEGINGSPVVAPVSCPSGGGGFKIGVSSDAGPAYILNGDGSSCYGDTGSQYNPLQTNALGANGHTVDTPTFAAVGYPAFGTLDGHTISMFDQGAGIFRALDVAVNGEQRGGEDFILGWDASSGQFHSGYPAVSNDLGFLTGETVGSITADPSQQDVLGGTASLDVEAFDAAGQPASTAWPKLSGDWLVATPTLGSFGTLDFSSTAHRDVVTITRSGTLSVYGTPAGACFPASWPNWHHDIANSGDYTRDATPPGVAGNLSLSRRVLHFAAPGDDGECGRATRYQVATSNQPITADSFARGRKLSAVPAPAPAGTMQSLRLPKHVRRYVAIRAVDDQGNVGLPAEIDTRAQHRARRPRRGCLALAPQSSLTRVRVRGKRLSLGGTARSNACGTGRVAHVLVGLARGRRAPVYVSARVRHGRFSVRLRRRLARGRYTVVSLAVDSAGRVELPWWHDLAGFRVR